MPSERTRNSSTESGRVKTVAAEAVVVQRGGNVANSFDIDNGLPFIIVHFVCECVLVCL